MRALLSILFLFSLYQTYAQKEYYAEVHFDLDKYHLRNDALKKLDSICKKLEEVDSIKVFLTGHCDSIGSIVYNQQLSKKRATAIKNYFKKYGLNINETDWYGEGKPRYEKNNDSLNRRVEIKLIIQDKIIPKPRRRISEPLTVEALEGLRPGDVIVLRKAQFELGKTTMVGDSVSSVKLIFDFMVRHPKARILINGHVCCNNDYGLSLARANRIRDILSQEGINPSRMDVAGWSNRRPMVIEKTKADEQINRRIEIKILSL